MSKSTEATQHTGTVEKFNEAHRSGVVKVEGERYAFHSSSYSSRSATPPRMGDSVDVILVGASLLEVRARK